MRWTAPRTSDSSEGAAPTAGRLTVNRKLKQQTTNISERINSLLFISGFITFLFPRILFGGRKLCAHLRAITEEPRDSAQSCCNESGRHIVPPQECRRYNYHGCCQHDPDSFAHLRVTSRLLRLSSSASLVDSTFLHRTPEP